MVIDVTQRSFNQLLSEAFDTVTKIINEFEYSLLMDKYNYLQENGVIMEEDDENNSLKTKIKGVIEKIIQKVKDVLRWIKQKFNAIKSKLTGNKKKEVEDVVKESEKEASEAIDELNKVAENPDSESGKKASGIFGRFKKKQEDKAKKFKDIKLEDTVDDYFFNILDKKDIPRLRSYISVSITEDPEFIRGDYDYCMKLVKDRGIDITEEYHLVPGEDPTPENQNDWTKTLFFMKVECFRQNFAKERVDELKKISKIVF